MHKCLLIREIQSNIFTQEVDSQFDSFHPADHDRKLRKTQHMLGALAQTCRLFSDLALDILYGELDDLSPLVRCLPKDLVGRVFHGERLTLLRAMRPTDWDIFLRYASRVRRLEILDHSDVDDSIFTAISFAPMKPLPFPKLKHLTVSRHLREWPHTLRPFLGPQLLGLNLEFPLEANDESRDLAFFCSLNATCPSLTSVHLKPRYSDGHAVGSLLNVLMDVICGWDHLKEVSCDVLSKDALVHLSRLDSLQSLSFMVNSTDFHSNFSSQYTVFPSLRHLTLYPIGNSSLDCCISLLKRLSSCPVSFSVFPDRRFELRALQRLLSTLDSFSNARDTLERLCIVEAVRYPEGVQETVINFGILKVLPTYHHLREVKIDTSFPISMDDVTLKEVVSAWPKLQKLSLNATHGCRDHSKVTTSGFVTLLRLCPELEELGIVIVAEGISPKFPLSMQGPLNNKISELQLGDSKIGATDYVYFAVIISIVLPRVHSIYCWVSQATRGLEEGNEQRTRWITVLSLLPTFADIKDPGEKCVAAVHMMDEITKDDVKKPRRRYSF